MTSLFWIPIQVRGRLAIMPRPRGGDWLEDDLKSWHRAGVGAIVSLLTAPEVAQLELFDESELCARIGLRFVTAPIADRKTPDSMLTAASLITDIHTWLKESQSVVIHCRMGIGRSSMIAACVMALYDIHPREAFRTMSAVRGLEVPDTEEQRQWVERFIAHVNT